MIETAIMMGSLLILGYAFYINSRLLWIYKAEKGMSRWLYGLSTVFMFVTYFLFAMVMFSFFANPSESVVNLLNIIIGVFFLSSAGLIGAVMKYHLSSVRRVIMATAKEGSLPKAEPASRTQERKDYSTTFSGKPTERSNWWNTKGIKEIQRLEGELAETKKLDKLAVDKELRIIELWRRRGRGESESM